MSRKSSRSSSLGVFHATATTFALGACVTGASCTLSSWNDFESGAAVVALASSSPFPSQTFGSLLGAYQTTDADGRITSRLVVGSGRIDIAAGEVDGMYAVFSGWDDTRLALGRKLYDQCDGASTVCPADAATSLAAIPDVVGGHACVAAGAPDAPVPGTMPALVVGCESSDDGSVGSVRTVVSAAAADARFGAAIAPLPVLEGVTDPHDVALVSAPNANELWVMSDGALLKTLSIAGATPAAGALFGETLATAAITSTDAAFLARLPAGDSHVLVAVAAPGEERVYMLVVPIVAGAASGGFVVGCLDAPASAGGAGAGFGSALVAGDVDGDGIPEIAIGANLRSALRADVVSLFSLTDASDAGLPPIGCADPTSADDPLLRTLACVDDVGGSATTCEGFGASLAMGDADGDGHLELLVGAPLASVRTTSHAGAAFLFHGDASLDVFTSDANEPRVLVDGSPNVNDTLGLGVTFLPSQLHQADAATDARARPRAEPVASAPGANRLFVFLCTGLVGDAIDEEPARCIVER